MLSLFMTGTGTDVGKTYLSCLILSFFKSKELKPIYYKPIATGCSSFLGSFSVPDQVTVQKHVNVETEIGLTYEPACAPYAIEENFLTRENGYHNLLNQFHKIASLKRPVLVEGIGGVAVPLWMDYLLSDLIVDFRIPVLLIASDFLGTINHTLLSIEHLKNKNIVLLGFILNQNQKNNDSSVEKNATIIEKFSKVPHLFTVRYGQKFLTQFQEDRLWSEIRAFQL